MVVTARGRNACISVFLLSLEEWGGESLYGAVVSNLAEKADKLLRNDSDRGGKKHQWQYTRND